MEYINYLAAYKRRWRRRDMEEGDALHHPQRRCAARVMQRRRKLRKLRKVV